MNALQQWTNEVCAALAIEVPPQADTASVLELAREVAHGVLRPAAPWSAYLMGLAVGAGADPAAVAASITELARRWPQPTTS